MDDLAPRCSDCNGPGPLTGLGPSGEVEWLCLVCLNRALQGLAEKLRQLRKARLN
jgi:hypothetical protein